MDASWWTSTSFSVLLTVLSLLLASATGIGTLLAWWRSNVSKDAKQAAETAEQQAADHLAAAEKLSAEVERLADIAAGPVYTIHRAESREAVLETRGEPVMVESLEGYHPMTRATTVLRPHLEEPARLAVDEPISFVTILPYGRTAATHVSVKLLGRPEPILVRLPPKPPIEWETSRRTGVQ
ncbi:MAG: hypothetical protein L0G85_12680 [Kocuria sp.]|nr:hypothetical protein [Kocuria sp.]